MARKAKRLVFGAIGGLSIGLFLVGLPLFETGGDRERILRDLEVPPDFRLLAIEDEGSRLGLFNDGPRSTAYFSARWADGSVCAAVEQLAHRLSANSAVPDERFPRAACAYSFLVRSGRLARLVNEWEYGGWIVTYPPSETVTPLTLHGRGLAPDRTLVVIRLLGKMGY